MAREFTVSLDEMLAVLPDGTRLAAVPVKVLGCEGCALCAPGFRCLVGGGDYDARKCMGDYRKDGKLIHWKQAPEGRHETVQVFGGRAAGALAGRRAFGRQPGL